MFSLLDQHSPDTIAYLGPANVFVSIVENYSNDRSRSLRDLQTELDRLNVKNRILIQDETIKRPGHELESTHRLPRRHPQPNPRAPPRTRRYDKVIFSNDVFIEPESVIELLETNGGNFDFACGLDFGHFGLYDAWVLRDRAGRLASGIWPYFFDKATTTRSRGDARPVFTCWNGIVAFVADPFLPYTPLQPHTLHELPPNPLPDTPHARAHRPVPALTPPCASARPAGECFSSESFLVPYDFRRVMDLQRIYVNSRVIVGYSWKYTCGTSGCSREARQVVRREGVDGADAVRAHDRRRGRRCGVGCGDCHPWW
ncbi:hypothetical protein A0H81_05807 [Grifola frondosa]|uniref:Alpha-1,3-mannosyltransferase CMT1 n=1 Tax=Grifola frondosa TaxID=5627 RepID=A0A1C7MBU5_GRIFR|nr:hypothetical protein A0H81_05807 [Grifola frondosa]